MSVVVSNNTPVFQERIGPLMISLTGPALTDEEKEMLSLPAVGGVILFARNYTDKQQLIELTAAIRKINAGCMIAVDHEGGRVQRLVQEFTPLPAAAVFGRIYDTNSKHALQLVYDVGCLVAEELQEVGIDLGFSPVLDIDAGASTVIGDRAFHQSPQVVAQLAAAFIKGLHNGNMLSVGKHYPGHGAVMLDTHKQPVYDSRSLEEIKQRDMIPYQYLIQRDLLDAVMTAHIIYEQVDSKPATISQSWLQQILREEQHFTGVIFSDDLSMQGISDILAQTSIMSVLESQCQVLLVCNDKNLIRKSVDQLSAVDIHHDLDKHCQYLAQCWGQRKKLLTKQEHAPVNRLSIQSTLKRVISND